MSHVSNAFHGGCDGYFGHKDTWMAAFWSFRCRCIDSSCESISVFSRRCFVIVVWVIILTTSWILERNQFGQGTCYSIFVYVHECYWDYKCVPNCTSRFLILYCRSIVLWHIASCCGFFPSDYRIFRFLVGLCCSSSFLYTLDMCILSLWFILLTSVFFLITHFSLPRAWILWTSKANWTSVVILHMASDIFQVKFRYYPTYLRYNCWYKTINCSTYSIIHTPALRLSVSSSYLRLD